MFYPYNYDVEEGEETPDGVFYVEQSAYYKSTWGELHFIAAPTEGAKVVGDVLEYPVQNGKQLKLKFTVQSPNKMKHADAREYCKKQSLRLPTIRELFDFCAAGVTEPNYGPYFEKFKYPATAPCAKQYGNWSASVTPYRRASAWIFYYYTGSVSAVQRSDDLVWNRPAEQNGVRCVGPAQ